MTLREGIRKYPKAIGWSVLLSLAVVMEGHGVYKLRTEIPIEWLLIHQIACLPVEMGGHNWLWRKTFIELIRLDPAWQGGEYESQPLVSLLGAMGLLQVMFQGQEDMQREYPTREAVDRFFDLSFQSVLDHPDALDVTNQIYAWNASWDYKPEPDLHQIRAPLTAVNTGDDLMNPPQLRLLEEAVENRMSRGLGKAVIIPTSNDTFGHGSYIKASLWVNELERLLGATEKSGLS